jgi:Flp pilus assembly secretin CpaC
VFSIIRTLTVPGISYSLNIINSADNQSKILAKPSLMALSGQKSVFFSGVNINAAATSGGTGDSVSIEKEIGVRLEVTPEFLSPGKVRLEVKAERTFLTDPSSSVVFDYRLDTTKTLVTSFVVLNMGETLVLGGLTEQEDTDILDGVPGLKNMPGLSVLFSEKIERRFKKSITILLTPRAPGTPAPTETPSVGAKPASLSDRNLMILLKNIGDDGKTFFPEDDRTFEFKRSVGRQFIGPEDIKYKAKNAEILETAKHFLGELEGSL